MALYLGLENVLSVMHRCQEYESMINEARSNRDPNKLQGFEIALTKLCTHVLEFLCSAYATRNSNALERVAQAIWSPEKICNFEVTRLKLENEIKTEASVNSNIQHMLLAKTLLTEFLPSILATSKDTNTLIRYQMDGQRRLKMLNWISKTPVEDHHRDAGRNRSDDHQTCNWVLERQEFQEWKEAQSSRILWIHGKRKLTT